MQEQKKKEYQKYVNKVTPKHNLFIQMIKAFFVGGAICLLGQGFLECFKWIGFTEEQAASWCTLILIFISVLLTGFNIYPRITKFAGAGSLVPITGFANAVAAPAIEYKKEGQIFGVGCKIFTIAGPVILYGIFVSWLFGAGYYFLTIIGVIKL